MKFILMILLFTSPLLSNKLSDLYLKKACNKNIALGCYNLGELYLKRKSLQHENLKALTLLDKSCRLNYSKACHRLGEIYQEGKEASRNNRKALFYYKKACFLNSYRSCINYNLLKNKR